MPEVKGLTTDDLLKDLAKTVPPERPHGVGVTVSELREVVRQRAALWIEEMTSQGLVPVLMRGKLGRRVHVYMSKEQAEQYPDWIIKE